MCSRFDLFREGDLLGVVPYAKKTFETWSVLGSFFCLLVEPGGLPRPRLGSGFIV
jgi:hypothetical protein